jgi:transmembrane sensor
MHMHTERYIWLLSKKLSGDLSADEFRELEALLKADPRLAKGQELMQRFWKNQEAGEDPVHTSRAFERLAAQLRAANDWEAPAPKRRWLGPFLKIAAAVILIAGTAWMLLEYNHTGSQLRTERNKRGTRSLIKLADGTNVWLNADSEIKYPAKFSENARDVYLSGEAYFDVAHDAQRPFVVHTDRMLIHVLGTSFNIKSYPGDGAYETTLISGEVEVTIKAQPDKKIRLKPAEKLVLPAGDSSVVQQYYRPQISAPTYMPLEDSAIIETAWVDNKLLFRDETFATLATRMERWYNVTIRFENKSLEQVRFTGIFKKETLSQALEALQITESFNYRQEEDAIIIY